MLIVNGFLMCFILIRIGSDSLVMFVNLHPSSPLHRDTGRHAPFLDVQQLNSKFI